MVEISLNKIKANKTKENPKFLLVDEEEILADELKQICNDKGQETNPIKSVAIFHDLAHIYQNRSQLQHGNSTSIMINLIKSAALYNAAITRSSQNVEKLQNDLKQLCVDILKFAGAKQTNADLVQEAERVKEKIQNMRRFVNKNLLKDTDKDISINQEQEKIEHIKNLQNKITQDYTQIMADLSQYCEEVMGEAPCKFTVVGMGSLARKEITPYSDFEHIIVLEEISQQKTQKGIVINYFRWFSVIFHIVVLNLQETILPSVLIYSLNDKASKHGDWFYDAFTTRGISFDGMMPHACKFPLGRQQFTDDKPWTTELIKPVSEMLKYVITEEDLRNGYHLKDILTKICFVYGDKTIFDDFELGVHKIIKLDDKKIQIDTIKRQMLEDLDKFAARSTILELLPKKEFNLKQVIFRSTTLFIAALGRVYNFRATSSFDIIEQLKKKQGFNEKAKHRLMYAVAIACEIRLKWYMKCQRQNDAVKSKSCSAIKMLSDLTTKKTVVSYFQTAYELQCHISKTFDLDKKYFYSNPILFTSSLYYCLGEKQKFVAFTKEYINIYRDKKTRLFTFDDCMKQNHDNDKKVLNSETFTYQEVFENQPSFNENITSLNENFATAKHLKEFGTYLRIINQYDEALEYFKNEEKILLKIPNNCHSSQTAIPKIIKKINVTSKLKTILIANAKEFPQSTSEYKKKNLSEKSLDHKLSNCQHRIGCCLMNTNQFTEALDYLKRSLAIKEQISLGVDSDPSISDTLHKIGRCLMNMNQHTEALDYLKRSLTIAEQISLVVNPDISISTTLHDIFRCLINMKQITETWDFWEQIFAIEERTSLIADSHSSISDTLHTIGCCLINMNQLNEALDYLKRSLAIKERISLTVDSDPSISTTLHTIGRCLINMNQFNKALDYLKRSLAIKERISLAVDSASSISATLHEIGRCLIYMNQLNKALDYLKRSLAIKERISLAVDSDPRISTTLHTIGRCLINMNQFNKALDYLKRSLAIKERISLDVDSDPRISTTLHTIGCCLINMNQFNEALDYLKRSLEIKERISLDVDSDPRISTTLHEIGCCFINMNQFTEALDYLKRSLAIKERISLTVDTDGDISTTLHEIGRCLINRNQFTEALNYLKRSLAIKERISLTVDTDRDISTILHEIGRCLINMNQFTEALDYLK